MVKTVVVEVRMVVEVEGVEKVDLKGVEEREEVEDLVTVEEGGGFGRGDGNCGDGGGGSGRGESGGGDSGEGGEGGGDGG